jgi:hypothetical protein
MPAFFQARPSKGFVLEQVSRFDAAAFCKGRQKRLSC